MSGQSITLLDGLKPPATHTTPRPSALAPESHGRTGPDSPWCRCGRLREHCVSDEVRMIWGSLLDLCGR